MITRRMMGQVGRSAPGRLGAPPTPPAACFAIPGFEQAWIAAGLEAAQQASTDAELEAIMMAKLEELCTPPIDDSGPGLPVAGAPCNSYENKYAVQVALRGMGLYADTLDGRWGENSQAALDASGMTFEQLAPGCTPPAPKWSGSAGGAGGGGGTTTPGDLTDVNTGDKKESTSSAWMWGLGAVVLGLGAAVVITRKKQPYAKNPIDLGDLDGDQRSLFQELDLIATNDGDAYRNRDAKLAVDRAWRELRRSKDEALREDYRVIRNHVVKSVASNWNRW